MKSQRNRIRGDEFEAILKKMTQLCGLFPEKNQLTAFYTQNGVQIIKSELDFKIINPHGRIAYVDAKSYQGDYFTYSDLNPRQIERAVTYGLWKVPAGFVVWFRGIGRIAFYTGDMIKIKGPGSRFTLKDGISLGPLIRFDMNLIFNDL